MTKKNILLISASITMGIVTIVVLASVVVYAAYDRMYEGRIFPGVRVIGTSVGGLTHSEASLKIGRSVDQQLGAGQQFLYSGGVVTMNLQGLTSDPDTSHDLLTYDIPRAIDDAYNVGRHGTILTQALTRLRLRIYPATIFVAPTIDTAGIAKHISQALDGKLVQTRDARFDINTLVQPPVVTILPEQKGVVVDTGRAIDALTQQARAFRFSPITLIEKAQMPKIVTQDLEPFLPRIQNMLNQPMPVFSYQDRVYPVAIEQFAKWITVTGTSPVFDVVFDSEALSTDLAQIVPDVEQEAKNGSLVVKDGKAVSFVAGTKGIEIDRAALIDELTHLWPASTTLPLIVHETEGKIAGEDPERLGITELLGVGTSNFSGSPSNRRKNIAHGAALVNGTVVQPGEIFSLLKTLGPIDGAHQWLPELVIKGNETKPEFGGGLCQIGTTTFRGAMSAGLPIIERRNHSYRVRYYEPAGTDATIYDPAPDFRFMNDTQHPVLINAYIKGDVVNFEFWGTRDGRKAEQTVPRVTNVVAPPPMKLIETLDLPVGSKKCTETAHAGADAEFTYTVTYQSGEVKKEVFRSRYKPWQAVCLIGVKALSAGGASSSTSALPVTP